MWTEIELGVRLMSENNMKESTVQALLTIVDNGEIFDAVVYLSGILAEQYNNMETELSEKRACIRGIRKINNAKYKDDAIEAFCE